MTKNAYNNEGINVRIPYQQIEMIDALAENGRYLNRSDFIREAIRDKLTSMNIKSIEDAQRKNIFDEVWNL